MSVLKFLFLFFCIFCFSHNVKSDDSFTKQFPKQGETIYQFVPNSWKIIAEARGDLNFDKKKDIALVIESKNFKRVLLILFNKGKHLELFQAVAEVIPNKIKKLDTFSGISIRSNQLILEQQGGEKQIWKLSQNYQFRKDAFYLISQKNVEIDIQTGKIRERELNFLKGIQTLRVLSKEERLGNEKVQKLPKENLQKLQLEFSH